MKIDYITGIWFRVLLALIAVAGVSPRGWCAPQLPEPELSWKNVTVDGKKTAVFCIFRDSRGIVWLGTNNGLYFYDGVTAHPVGKAELYGTQVYSIAEKNDTLYIGCNNGLLTYDYPTGRITENVTSTPREIRVLLLVDDNLWIGGLNGICKLDLRSGKLTDYSKGLPHKSVYSMLRDSRGVLYAGTYDGLARWNSNAEKFIPLEVKTGNDSHNSTLFVNCLLEADDKESIYIGGEGFLLKYTPANERWETITAVGDNNIKSMSKGDAGHILIGTHNGVLDMAGDSIKHFRHDSREELSLADNEIWCIYADEERNIWTGHERGVSIASNSNYIRTIKLSTLAHSGEGNEIHLIYRDSKDNIWFGGTNGVIRLESNATPSWYRHSGTPKSLSHNRVRAIHEDTEHNMWFATDAGINRFDREKDNFDIFHIVDRDGEHNSNWVYALVEDGDHFWIGSFLNGLHYVDKSKFGTGDGLITADMSINTDTEPLKLTNDLVNDVIKDRNGDIWILLFRDNILTRLNPATRHTDTYDIFALTGGYPTHISTDRSGKVWCAFKGGVIIFDTDNDDVRIIKFPPTNSDETTLAMGSVGDGMWVSTQSNVWRVDGNIPAASLLPIPQKSYTAIYEDSASNKVYLGGTDEIVEVDRNIVRKATDYRTIKMILNDRGEGNFNLSDIRDGVKGMTIPYGGGITLVVSSLDYSPESVQRYMYKLAESPADTLGGWVVMPEGANSITFSDLKMGKYDVLVKTVGSPLAPVSIPLTVKAPPALSWWAITAYAIIAAGLVIWIVWYMRRRNIRAIRERERLSTLENVERKLSFLSNISHDLKTPLSMIIGPVSLLKEKAKDPESKKSLEAVYDNAVRLNNMIHRTLELRHLEDDDENLLILSVFDVVEFCKGVFEVFKENNPQKNFIFHASNPRIQIEADAVKFESVITNLLSNACKYSDDGATISCGISQQGDKVEIVVSDDGLGISASDQPLVFQRMFRSPATSKLKEGTGLGLYLIKKYLELMDGNISLYSKEGQGTSFVVTLPISEKVQTSERRDVTPDDNGKPKILIVEDNLQISEFITGILDKEYTTLTADNGRTGLAIASSFIPDLIIADEMMPVMNGLEYVFNGIPIFTYRPEAYNPDLKWETTKAWNVGLDFGFMNNRITGTVDYYKRKTEDLLASVPCAAGTNFAKYILSNVGNVDSEGFELSINANIIDNKDWSWNVAANATWQKSRITNLTMSPDAESPNTLVGSSVDSRRVQVFSTGYAPYAFYVYKQIYDPKTGRPIEGVYADLNNDGQINSSDLYHYHSPAPDWILGLSTSLRYRKWTLSTSLRANIGNYVYNAMAMNTGAWETVSYNAYQLNNMNRSYLDTGFSMRQHYSDHYVENASFLKMDNLQLSYDFGKVWRSVNLHLSANIQNVFTITNYSGIDPEVSYGIDSNVYPRPRTYSLTVGLNF